MEIVIVNLWSLLIGLCMVRRGMIGLGRRLRNDGFVIIICKER